MTGHGSALEKESKVESVHLEEAQQGDAPVYGIDEAHQKRVLRRIDLRLLPILGLLYSVCLVDRTNYSFAYVAGMAKDLHLFEGQRYTILIMVFFIGYVIFQLPSNIAIQKAGAANWLTFLGASFGAVLIGTGFTHSWSTMAVCRTLLGVTEAGYMPGCAYLITCWYTRYEVGKRLAMFWLGSVVFNAFAAMLPYALTQLKGTYGLNGWRWIFIIEGSITVGLSLIGWFLIIDFPRKADGFLNPEEKQFVIDRINNDRGDAEDDPITLESVIHHMKDWKLYFWTFNLIASTVPGYAYGYFKSIILTGMGYTLLQAQLLSIPPEIFSAVVAMISGWLSDWYKIRGPILAFHQLITVVGMLIYSYAKTNGARYVGILLAEGFFQYCVPGILTYQANNITSQSKRGVASAFCIVGSGLGGIIASVSFKSSESPHYTTGIWVAFAISIASIFSIIFMDLCLWQQNKKARERGIILEGVPGFRYTL